MERVDIVGSGIWGTVLALLLASKGQQVRLLCRREEVARDIIHNAENSLHLPGVRIPDSVKVVHLAGNVLADSCYVVMAVPSQHMRGTLGTGPFRKLPEDACIIHVTKGIEHYKNGSLSGKRMSEVVAEELGLSSSQAEKIAALSGPNIAAEIAAGRYAETVIACKDHTVADMWREIFAVPYRFAPQVTNDIAGVEFGGALKNIVAIACGMVDGLGLGDNTKTAVIQRGFEEMVEIGLRYGARRETFYGLAGIFDLYVTCNSRLSRNRLVGERVAQGKGLSVVLNELVAERRGEPEGPEMARIVYELNVHLNPEVTKAVYDALFSGSPPLKCVQGLFKG